MFQNNYNFDEDLLIFDNVNSNNSNINILFRFKKAKIIIPPKDVDVIFRLEKIINQEGQSNTYRLRNVTLFTDLC